MSSESTEDTRLSRDIRRKLERAESHLSALHESIQGFRVERNYAFINHTEAEGEGQWLSTWDVRRTKPFDPIWPILAGEILYHLNSCLDHLAWELASVKSFPQRPDRVTFPIYTRRQDFWKPGDPKKCERFRRGSGAWRLQRIPGAARQHVLDVQPYKHGDGAPDHPLWHLFELSNQDKHKALHVASSALKQQRLKDIRTNDLKIISDGIDNNRPFDNGAQRVFWQRVVATGPKPQIGLQGDFSFQEVFGEGSPSCVAGAPFFETMRSIYNYVVIDVFNARFNRLLGDEVKLRAYTEMGHA